MINLNNIFRELYEASNAEAEIKRYLKKRDDVTNAAEGGRLQVGRYKLEIKAKGTVIRFVVTAGKGTKKYAFYGTEIDYLKSQGYECTDGEDYVYEKVVQYDMPNLTNVYNEIESAINMIKNQSIGSLYTPTKDKKPGDDLVEPAKDTTQTKEQSKFDMEKFIEKYDSKLTSNGFYKVNVSTYVLEVVKFKDKDILVGSTPQITLKITAKGIDVTFYNSEYGFSLTNPGKDITKIFKSIIGQANTFTLNTKEISDMDKIDTFLGKIFSWINSYVSEVGKKGSKGTQTLKTNLGGIWVYKEDMGKTTKVSIELGDDVIKDLVSKGVTDITGNFLTIEDGDGDVAVKRALGILSQAGYTGKARVLVKNSALPPVESPKEKFTKDLGTINIELRLEDADKISATVNLSKEDADYLKKNSFDGDIKTNGYEVTNNSIRSLYSSSKLAIEKVTSVLKSAGFTFNTNIVKVDKDSKQTNTTGNIDMKAEVKPKMDKVTSEQKEQLTRIYNYAKKQLDLVNSNPEINFIYLEEVKELEFHKLPTVGLMLYTYDMDKKVSDLMKDEVVSKFYKSKSLKVYKRWHKTALDGKPIQCIIFIDAVFAKENKIRGLKNESLEVDDIVYYDNDLYVVSSICEDLCTIINESKEIKDVSIKECEIFE